mmetsp:Transcript_30991/g.66537  ORF Transcript_30991/g.66537 Transcript_30991/m.66537 type:complete len:222 (+) Transcript_30991:192-857(+)
MPHTSDLERTSQLACEPACMRMLPCSLLTVLLELCAPSRHPTHAEKHGSPCSRANFSSVRKEAETDFPSNCLPCSSLAHLIAASEVVKRTKTRSSTSWTSYPEPGGPPVPSCGDTQESTCPCLPHSIFVSSRMSDISSGWLASSLLIMLRNTTTGVAESTLRGGSDGSSPAFSVRASGPPVAAFGIDEPSVRRSLPSGATLVLPRSPAAFKSGIIVSGIAA